MGQIAQNPYRQKGEEWQQAMTLKRKAALEMLKAQKMLDRIEAESAESVPQSMISTARFPYHGEDAFSLDRQFIATISDVQVHAPHV